MPRSVGAWKEARGEDNYQSADDDEQATRVHGSSQEETNVLLDLL
jgi:hypothetical protein